MTTKEKIREIATVSAIMTENMFEAIHMSVKPSEGVIGAYYRTAELATKFVGKHFNVKDWEQFCNKNKCSDWEEYIIRWTLKQIKGF
jgi:hypothetical protein